jgi:hypothetical protein
MGDSPALVASLSLPSLSTHPEKSLPEQQIESEWSVSDGLHRISRALSFPLGIKEERSEDWSNSCLTDAAVKLGMGCCPSATVEQLVVASSDRGTIST